jgi:hypothetical protein
MLTAQMSAEAQSLHSDPQQPRAVGLESPSMPWLQREPVQPTLWVGARLTDGHILSGMRVSEMHDPSVVHQRVLGILVEGLRLVAKVWQAKPSRFVIPEVHGGESQDSS